MPAAPGVRQNVPTPLTITRRPSSGNASTVPILYSTFTCPDDSLIPTWSSICSDCAQAWIVWVVWPHRGVRRRSSRRVLPLVLSQGVCCPAPRRPWLSPGRLGHRAAMGFGGWGERGARRRPGGGAHTLRQQTTANRRHRPPAPGSPRTPTSRQDQQDQIQPIRSIPSNNPPEAPAPVPRKLPRGLAPSTRPAHHRSQLQAAGIIPRTDRFAQGLAVFCLPPARLAPGSGG